jgi:hypothetical protein
LILKFSEALVAKTPEMFEYVESGYVEKFVTYVTNSDYRKAVGLKKWIKEQITVPEKELLLCDEVAVQKLKEVISTVKYVPDQTVWNMPEYWQTAEETLALGTGDCEDGAVLLYVLCREAGVPASRLMLFAGSVIGGGHCCLFYKPDNYPLNWTILDWCYWPDKRPVGKRNMFDVVESKVYGQTIHSDGEWYSDYNNYIEAWFWFNENKTTFSLTRRH